MSRTALVFTVGRSACQKIRCAARFARGAPHFLASRTPNCEYQCRSVHALLVLVFGSLPKWVFKCQRGASKRREAPQSTRFDETKRTKSVWCWRRRKTNTAITSLLVHFDPFQHRCIHLKQLCKTRRYMCVCAGSCNTPQATPLPPHGHSHNTPKWRGVSPSSTPFR